MEREIDLKKISDGKLYTNKDMVKAGCGECQGCSDCCRGMGNSIFLDPMDIYRLTTGLECTFEDLLSTCVELESNYDPRADSLQTPRSLVFIWVNN